MVIIVVVLALVLCSYGPLMLLCIDALKRQQASLWGTSTFQSNAPLAHLLHKGVEINLIVDKWCALDCVDLQRRSFP
eukprot:5142989-Amphidinium_carterae.1